VWVTNRINSFTLGKIIQGIANYMHEVFPDTHQKSPLPAIAYNSNTLAKRADVSSLAKRNTSLFVFEMRLAAEFLHQTLELSSGHCLTASQSS
jgi:hypothetical protein